MPMVLVRLLIPILCFLWLLCPLAVFGQTASPAPSTTPTAAAGPGDEQVYAPFARRLRVAVKEPQVTISWEDVSGAAETYNIYRYTEEIVDANFDKAEKIAEVPKTESFYTDVPKNPGTYFYAVILKDKDGNLYSLLIPYRNKTVNGVQITKAASEGDQATDLTNIKATVTARSVDVSVLSSRNNRVAAMYRSTVPMLKAADLAKAVLLTTSNAGTFVYTDYPVPGIPYYYAAIDTEAMQAGVVSLVLGKNSLEKPVEIPLSNQTVALIKLPAARAVREFPLPDLNRVLGDSILPPRSNNKLEPDLAARIQTISARSDNSKNPKALLKPSLLPSDRTSSANLKGNSATLQEILVSEFSPGHYDKAMDKLEKLLAVPLSAEIRTKALYYLGQCKATTGYEKNALLDFLSVRDDLNEYANPWVQVLLSRI